MSAHHCAQGDNKTEHFVSNSQVIWSDTLRSSVFNVLKVIRRQNTLWATLGWCHWLTLCDPCFQVCDWTLVCLPVVVEIFYLCNLTDMKTQVTGQQFALKASFSVFHLLAPTPERKRWQWGLLQQFHHLVCKAIFGQSLTHMWQSPLWGIKTVDQHKYVVKLVQLFWFSSEGNVEHELFGHFAVQQK